MIKRIFKKLGEFHQNINPWSKKWRERRANVKKQRLGAKEQERINKAKQRLITEHNSIPSEHIESFLDLFGNDFLDYYFYKTNKNPIDESPVTKKDLDFMLQHFSRRKDYNFDENESFFKNLFKLTPHNLNELKKFISENKDWDREPFQKMKIDMKINRNKNRLVKDFFLDILSDYVNFIEQSIEQRR